MAAAQASPSLCQTLPYLLYPPLYTSLRLEKSPTPNPEVDLFTFQFLWIYLFMATLSLHCYVDFSLVAARVGYSLVAM